MRKIKLIAASVIFCALAITAKAQVVVKAWNDYTAQGWREILLEFDIQNGWHIFAPYEQEFGQPLVIDWHLPDNTEILETSYSRPKRFDMSGFIYDGYEHKAFYKTTIKNDGVWQNMNIDLSWQVCADDECLPQKTNLLILPQKSPEFAEKIKEAESSFAGTMSDSLNLWKAVMMAFLAGLILNLMPCVLPVLGIKILSCLKAAPKQRINEAFFYTSGVILSMLGLAALLRCLRVINPHLGWGFQMQSPWFIGGMLVLFIILTMLAFETINLHSKWLNKISALQFKDCRINAFASGLLAVLIASPCTAPFMGAAIGYAITAPSYVYFPVFFSLGFGYALPFALLTLFPKFMQKVMPRPGKWMRTLKMILGIPLLFTCLWLGWLLFSQLGVKINSSHMNWQEYSAAKVEQALTDRQPIFIDFTADWCITCLVNKKTSLYSQTMNDLSQDKGILLLKADMTTANPEASKGLKKYHRAGVPLYVYYDGKSDDFVLLPPILTPQILQEYIK